MPHDRDLPCCLLIPSLRRWRSKQYPRLLSTQHHAIVRVSPPATFCRRTVSSSSSSFQPSTPPQPLPLSVVYNDDNGGQPYDLGDASSHLASQPIHHPRQVRLLLRPRRL